MKESFQRNIEEFLEYLDINEDEFWEVVDSWRLPHLWDKIKMNGF